MRSHRGFLAVAVLVLAPVLAGCGDDTDSGDAPPSSSSPDSPGETTDATSSAATEETTDASAGLTEACEVLTPADLEAAFGVPFGEPVVGAGVHAEQEGLTWQSHDCSFEAEDLVEVKLALTGPDDFTEGSFGCGEPLAIASTVTPAEVAGALEAWWEVGDREPLETTLRVCTEGYNFDIDLEYEDGVDFEGDPMQQSIALAETALGVLGG